MFLSQAKEYLLSSRCVALVCGNALRNERQLRIVPAFEELVRLVLVQQL